MRAPLSRQPLGVMRSLVEKRTLALKTPRVSVIASHDFRRRADMNTVSHWKPAALLAALATVGSYVVSPVHQSEFMTNIESIKQAICSAHVNSRVPQGAEKQQLTTS